MESNTMLDNFRMSVLENQIKRFYNNWRKVWLSIPSPWLHEKRFLWLWISYIPTSE